MAERVRRFDYVQAEQLAPPVVLANGWLRLDAKIARCGIQEYEQPDGTIRRELRDPEDVFDAESLRSFGLVPVCNTHPPMMLDAQTAKQFAVGALGNVRKLDDDWVAGELLVHDGNAISSIHGGRQQCSNGYSCTLDEVPGVHAKYGRYDARQRVIRGNHMALVDAARAGAEARVRLDSAGSAVIPSTSVPPPTLENKMPQQIRIDGTLIEVSDATAPAIQALVDKAINAALKIGADGVTAAQVKADAAEKRLGIVKRNAVALISTVAGLRAHIDSVQKKLMPCDECDGSGKVKDEAGASAKCGNCDGSGHFTKTSGMEPDGDEGEDMDADELETEQTTENEAGKAADKADRAAKRKIKADEAEAADRKRRKDSLDRMIARGVKARVALEIEARKHLGADAKLDGLDEVAIKKLVITKLSPTTKLDGLDAVDVLATHRVLVAQQAAAPAGADLARAGTVGAFIRPTVQQADGAGLTGRAKMLHNLAQVGQQPAK